MLPYPSGDLHMGHVFNYTLGDVFTHVSRRQGYTVLRPMGYDAFGLNAENAAIREGGHPRAITQRNIEAIRRQMRRMGWAIDWSREVSTCGPEYYRWTQWIFLRFLVAGLAYRREAPVKWCPNDQTVLANEQVIDGRCERCGAEVIAKSLEQWFFRITAYAEQLLDEMALLESWPERVLTMQRNWIGRSEGAEVTFRVEELGVDVPVFTTRPDTLFGATFFVLAPEHQLVGGLVRGTEREAEVLGYVSHAAAQSAVERADADKPKTGVFTGRSITNPVNGEQLPIWVADYVLMEYGTGAIMGVPGHDERDYDFARQFGLEVRQVVEPAEGAPVELPYVDKGGTARSVNSGRFSGLPTPEAIAAITAWLEQEELGRAAISYRLRDWLLSRQRYWGCPIPIVYCDECGMVPVPEDQLPVLLPEVTEYLPRGRSPLAAAEEWVRTTCPTCGGEARRETDTMDTFVDSSWYYLRYCDPHNEEAAFSSEVVDYWNPVDLYLGGTDHATMHMIYARFWIKVLNDLGFVSYREPFTRFFANGWVTLGKLKMSKRAGNIVGPDDFVERYGADACRLNIMFLGPADQDMEWTEASVEGMLRFIRRLWRVVHAVAEAPPSAGPREGTLARKAHETIAKVTDDIGRRFAFNTAIAAVMELVNELSRDPTGADARFAAE